MIAILKGQNIFIKDKKKTCSFSPQRRSKGKSHAWNKLNFKYKSRKMQLCTMQLGKLYEQKGR